MQPKSEMAWACLWLLEGKNDIERNSRCCN